MIGCQICKDDKNHDGLHDFENKVEFDGCIALSSTISALLIYTENYGDLWIPISQIDITSDITKVGDRGTLIISEWLAIEKELV